MSIVGFSSGKRPLKLLTKSKCRVRYLFNGIVNMHNCSYWSDQKQKIMLEIRKQHCQKRPLFMSCKFNEKIYLEFLETTIHPTFEKYQRMKITIIQSFSNKTLHDLISYNLVIIFQMKTFLKAVQEKGDRLSSHPEYLI